MRFPKVAQDAIRKHSLDWINKLYVDSMLVYDKSLIDRLKADPKRTVVFPDEADAQAAQDGVRAGDPGMGEEEPAQWRNLPSRAGGDREIPREQIACDADRARTDRPASRRERFLSSGSPR